MTSFIRIEHEDLIHHLITWRAWVTRKTVKYTHHSILHTACVTQILKSWHYHQPQYRPYIFSSYYTTCVIG